MKSVLKYFILIVSLLLIVVFIGLGNKRSRESRKTLLCYIGGTMTPVMKDIAVLYEKKTGKKVNISTAGSGECLATIQLRKKGDIFICHDPWMDTLMKRGLGVNAWTIAELVPVIVVQKDNPKNIKGLQDLLRPDIRLMFPSYEHSTLGNILPEIFKNAGIDFAKLNTEKKIPTHRSGSHVANLIKMKNADAGIVWQAVAHLRRESLDVISIQPHLPEPYVDTITSATGRSYLLMPVKVTACTLSCSEKQEDAVAFSEFLLSSDVRNILNAYGFKTEFQGKEYINGVDIRKEK